MVRDTLLNNTSFNYDRFEEDRSIIAGYPEGRSIIVTYFSQNYSVTDVQSKIVDTYSGSKNNVHMSFTEIRNFELRIPSEISFEYDGDSNKSKMTAEALILPMFTPRISDVFFYQLRDGKIGIFNITKTERLTIGQDTYHKIAFVLNEYLTAESRDRYRRQSGEPFYFDKTKFIVGNAAMLTSEGFLNQKDLRQLRQELIHDYLRRFYDKSYSSFMRPDGVYDPYVVTHWNKIIAYNESNTRPTQILISTQNYYNTIWSLMTDNPIKNLDLISKHSEISSYEATFWDVNITSLLNTKFVSINNDAVNNPKVISQGYSYENAGTMVTPLDEEYVKQRTAESVAIMREAFYGSCLPRRNCIPHQHISGNHYECALDQCLEPCSEPCMIHQVEYHAPFPIVSDNLLFSYWLKMSELTPSELTDSHMAEVRGYLDWYRGQFEGTFSRRELEIKWRESQSIDPEESLNEEQMIALMKYIENYRLNYLPIMSDTQLEYQYQTAVTTKTLEEFILEYRDLHGYQPDDTYYEDTPPEVDRVPAIFKSLIQQKQPPCHRFCYQKCGGTPPATTTPVTPVEPTYVFSNEFYLGSHSMTPFEKLVYDAIVGNELDVHAIIQAISNYATWDNDSAFYQHLMAIFLIDKSLHWLRFHS